MKRSFVLVLMVLMVFVAIVSSAQAQETEEVQITYNGDCDWTVSFTIEGLRPNREVIIDADVAEIGCGDYEANAGWEDWETGRRTNSEGEFVFAVTHHGWGAYVYTFRTGSREETVAFVYGSPESYVDSPTPPVSTADICSGALEPTLEDGDRGRVTYTDGSPTAMRDEPQGDIIRRLPEGTRFSVISDPVCTSARNGHLWWVQIRIGSQRGWVPFGYEGGEYWIEPVPQR